MTPGEEIRATVEYDLFDNNINGLKGIYIKTDLGTGKCLIFYPQFREWAELKENQFERVSPGHVTSKNLSFIKTTKKSGEHEEKGS